MPSKQIEVGVKITGTNEWNETYYVTRKVDVYYDVNWLGGATFDYDTAWPIDVEPNAYFDRPTRNFFIQWKTGHEAVNVDVTVHYQKYSFKIDYSDAYRDYDHFAFTFIGEFSKSSSELKVFDSGPMLMTVDDQDVGWQYLGNVLELQKEIWSESFDSVVAYSSEPGLEFRHSTTAVNPYTTESGPHLWVKLNNQAKLSIVNLEPKESTVVGDLTPTIQATFVKGAVDTNFSTFKLYLTTESGVSQITQMAPGLTLANNGCSYVPPVQLLPGPGKVRIELDDVSGVRAIAETNFTIAQDVDPPTLIVNSPDFGEILATMRPEFRASWKDVGTSGIDLSSFRLSLDQEKVIRAGMPGVSIDADEVRYTFPYNIRPGAHEAEFSISDNHGNNATVSMTFQVPFSAANPFISGLPVVDLKRIGAANQVKLNGVGITTILDLASADRQTLINDLSGQINAEQVVEFHEMARIALQDVYFVDTYFSSYAGNKMDQVAAFDDATLLAAAPAGDPLSIKSQKLAELRSNIALLYVSLDQNRVKTYKYSDFIS